MGLGTAVALILISELDEEEEKRVRPRDAGKENRAIEQRGAALLWPEGRNSPTLGSLPSIPEERVEGRKHALKGGMEGWRAGAHIRRKDSGKSIQTVTIIHLHMTEPVTDILGGIRSNERPICSQMQPGNHLRLKSK